MQRVQSTKKEEPKRDTRWKPGQRGPGRGRQKGTPNKMTKLLKECIMDAMDRVGADNKGKGEATGYLAMVAWKYPEVFIPLAAKLLPMQVTGKDGSPLSGGTVSVRYETVQELEQALKARGLPPPSKMIDVSPTPIRQRSQKNEKDD